MKEKDQDFPPEAKIQEVDCPNEYRDYIIVLRNSLYSIAFKEIKSSISFVCSKAYRICKKNGAILLHLRGDIDWWLENEEKDELERIQNFFSWIDDQDFEDFKVIQITPWDNDLNDRFIDYGDWKDNPFNLNLRCTLFYEDPDREVSSLSSFS